MGRRVEGGWGAGSHLSAEGGVGGPGRRSKRGYTGTTAWRGVLAGVLAGVFRYISTEVYLRRVRGTYSNSYVLNLGWPALLTKRGRWSMLYGSYAAYSTSVSVRRRALSLLLEHGVLGHEPLSVCEVAFKFLGV